MAKLYDFPEEGELVMATVQNVKNYGAFVFMDEYDNKEGFIHIAEVATGWIKYIRDFVREGQKVVCKVMRVEESKGHVDLSLKQVNEHQRREKIQQWKNEQKAHKLLEIVAEKEGLAVDKMYEKFGFDLIEKYGTLYQAFEAVVADPEGLKKDGFKGKWVKNFMIVGNENITLPYVNISGLLELTTRLPNGIAHIREALESAVNDTVQEECTVTVLYLGAPRYRLQVTAPEYKVAEEELRRASERAITNIENNQGEGKFTRKEMA